MWILHAINENNKNDDIFSISCILYNAMRKKSIPTKPVELVSLEIPLIVTFLLLCFPAYQRDKKTIFFWIEMTLNWFFSSFFLSFHCIFNINCSQVSRVGMVWGVMATAISASLWRYRPNLESALSSSKPQKVCHSLQQKCGS